MRARHSIRLRLITLLVSTILLVWLAVVALVYVVAGHEVEEVFDANLAQNAHILQALLFHEIEEQKEIERQIQMVTEELGPQGVAAYPRLGTLLSAYTTESGKERIELIEAVKGAGIQYNSGPFFITRYADGKMMMKGSSAPDIPMSADGFTDINQGDRTWRTYSVTEKKTGFVIQVGEELSVRSELVGYITRNTLTPLLLAIPIIGILIWAVVGHALASLQRVVKNVSMRAPEAIDPIDDRGTPSEIESLLIALNSLFERVAAAIKRERHFTADAAHELRTPLAALKTHLQVARGQTNEATTRHSLDQALEGVERATHSVEQLLLLARVDAKQAREMINAPVSLRDVAVHVVAALSQQAVDRTIDLGVDAPVKVIVSGDTTALKMMLRNLVDNALRYTPTGGIVTVAVGSDEEGPWIRVADNGVGVAIEDREKIFQRFHRGARDKTLGAKGSGLGLSIVQRIAHLHSAKIQIDDGLNGQGLSVKIVFPQVLSTSDQDLSHNPPQAALRPGLKSPRPQSRR